MKIKSVIVDAVNQQPLPGAIAVVSDSLYRPLSEPAVSDENGSFEVDNPLLENIGNFLLVGKEGYGTEILPPTSVNGKVVIAKLSNGNHGIVQAKRRITEIATKRNLIIGGVTVSVITIGILIWHSSR